MADFRAAADSGFLDLYKIPDASAVAQTRTRAQMAEGTSLGAASNHRILRKERTQAGAVLNTAIAKRHPRTHPATFANTGPARQKRLRLNHGVEANGDFG